MRTWDLLNARHRGGGDLARLPARFANEGSERFRARAELLDFSQRKRPELLRFATGAIDPQPDYYGELGSVGRWFPSDFQNSSGDIGNVVTTTTNAWWPVSAWSALQQPTAHESLNY